MTNLGNWILEIRNFVLDTLFPISCLSCGKDGIWLCDECLEKIPLRNEQVCPVCEKAITPEGRTCFECRKKDSIDGLLVSFSYQQEPIAHLIHLYKYRFAEDLHLPLGKLMLKGILNSEISLPDLILPVPLHKARLRWRGFNQAGLLAKYLSENMAPGFLVPVLDDFLIRRKNTTSQMKIKNYSERRKNMEGAFMIYPVKSGKAGAKLFNRVAGKNILLVDDVATTGSTLFECARVLKKAGAASVFGLVIARQEFNKKESAAKIKANISFFPG